MSLLDSKESIQWYQKKGECEDVITSTRCRLARNLIDFPFPEVARHDEKERVQSIVFDAISKLDNPYHFIRTNTLLELNKKAFAERGIDSSGTGLAFHSNNENIFQINTADHVRIICLEPGLNFQIAVKNSYDLDNSIQNSLQFAASPDFGYFTSSFKDIGSGMKLSFFAHLPSILFSGESENVFQWIREKGLSVSAVYGTGGWWDSSLGAYYEISTISSRDGNEFDQRVNIESAAKYLIEAERKFRDKCADNRTTEVENVVLKAIAGVKFCTLLNVRESIDIISALKWGIDMEMMSGLEHSTLRTLLYHMQDAHIEFLLRDCSYKFEHDIKNDMQLKKNRLRALLLQSACTKIHFGE